MRRGNLLCSTILLPLLFSTGCGSGNVEQAHSRRPKATTPVVPMPPRVVATVPIGIDGIDPVDVAVSPATRRVYVVRACRVECGENTEALVVIDSRTSRVVNELHFSAAIEDVAVDDAVAHQVYVTSPGEGAVIAIDTASLRVVGRVKIAEPAGIAVNPRTGEVYVADSATSTVVVVDGRLRKILARIPVGMNPFALAINPDANRIFVIHQDSQFVSVLDGVRHRLIANVPGIDTADDIAVNPITGRVYVTIGGAPELLVIDGSTARLIGTIKLDKPRGGVALDPGQRRIYVTDGSMNLFAVDENTHKILARVRVGIGAWNLAIDLTNRRIYVVNLGENSVSVLEF
jgi:YVTN family beta-propeller protein